MCSRLLCAPLALAALVLVAHAPTTAAQGPAAIVESGAAVAGVLADLAKEIGKPLADNNKEATIHVINDRNSTMDVVCSSKDDPGTKKPINASFRLLAKNDIEACDHHS